MFKNILIGIFAAVLIVAIGTAAYNVVGVNAASGVAAPVAGRGGPGNGGNGQGGTGSTGTAAVTRLVTATELAPAPCPCLLPN
jgi:hypothetical protein